MKDWSYKDAMELAERRFKLCIASHVRVADESTVVRCSCGWTGENPMLWRDHVDTACIVAQVKENRHGRA